MSQSEDSPGPGTTTRSVAVLALASAGVVLCAPVAGRSGWPSLASALAVAAGLLGAAAFFRALWTTMRRRPALEGGSA
jgi:type IV secretory pathway VirB2 component (pilin)